MATASRKRDRASWHEKMLTAEYHEKCCVDKCTNIARYMRWYGKKNGLFHFTICLCTTHRNGTPEESQQAA